jgi:hypothetical protein
MTPQITRGAYPLPSWERVPRKGRERGRRVPRETTLAYAKPAPSPALRASCCSTT